MLVPPDVLVYNLLFMLSGLYIKLVVYLAVCCIEHYIAMYLLGGTNTTANVCICCDTTNKLSGFLEP